MVIKVYIGSDRVLSFEDVQGATFHDSRVDASAGRYSSVAQWTKYGEESGSEELVNIDPARVKVSDVTIIDGELYIFVDKLG